MSTTPARGAETASRRAHRIAVVIGSTRPTRICPGIAAWSKRALAADSPLSYELLDLAEVDLPMLDEPLKAALNDYRNEHTKAWSASISSFDGFVFVVPQYNWGYPGVLKNALDYLYFEWRGKPTTSVTYGTRGGGKAADQLHQVFNGLHMIPLADRVEVVVTDQQVDENWQLKDVEETMAPYREQLVAIDAGLVEALAVDCGVDRGVDR